MPASPRSIVSPPSTLWFRFLVPTVLLWMWSLTTSAGGEERVPVLKLGSAKHLTWNDRLFERVEGVSFELQRPHVSGERLLTGDRPWESWQLGGMSSLLHENGKFRL
jgi:hypothetical protein